jgi:rod shape-determining protein MreC
MYRKQVRRRRAVLVLLVAASLTFLSLHFREGSGGPLHGVQRAVAAALGPVEEGANRALKPARDLVNWFGETFRARGERARLQREVDSLNNQLAQAQQELASRGELTRLSKTIDGLVPAGERAVTARVIGRSPTVWYSTIMIDKGSSAGLQVDDPVVAASGLAGRIAATTRGTAQVELITDPGSSVAGRVLPVGATGVVEPDVGDPSDLELNFVRRGRRIHADQQVVTAGFSVGSLSSLFPPGIPIGRITEASLEEQQAYQRVHLRAYVDLRDIQYVKVLVGAGKGAE